LKVLVTGGAGFLGSHVAKGLQEAGYQVIVFDLNPPEYGDYIEGDLTKLDDLLRATKGVDFVCHLGGVGDVYLAFDRPYLAAASNVAGTANLMEACLQNGVRKVIYASTWEVYGKPLYEPLDEEHPCNPDHPYNISKLAGEQLTLSYDKLKGVKALALRLGTAYGEGMRPNSVFSIFIQKAMQGLPLTIKGSGTQTRQFTHARDIVRAFLRALDSPLHGDRFNIVSPEVVQIKQLAELIAEKLPTQIVYEEARLGDIPPALVSSEKARSLLDWKPMVSFREGVFSLIEWHQQTAGSVAARNAVMQGRDSVERSLGGG
jgi:UDP-glucose 4-epimerase